MKVHILLSKDSPTEGRNYDTPCKSKVVHAHFLRSFEPGVDLRVADFRGVCWECLKTVTLAEFLKGRYLAFAIDGELLHQDLLG